MKLIIEERDLFEVDESYVFAHCISLDCAMGKGIALEFDKRFPKMKPVMIEHIKRNNIKYPNCLGYVGYPRTIFNLITKEHYYDKPTLYDLQGALYRLKHHVNNLCITKLAIPRIGCGLDRLNWNDVEELLEEIFHDVDIEILVCIK